MKKSKKMKKAFGIAQIFLILAAVVIATFLFTTINKSSSTAKTAVETMETNYSNSLTTASAF